MLVLRQVAEAGQEADRRPRRLHLRRVHRPVQRDHRGGAVRALRLLAGRSASPPRDLRLPRRLHRGPVQRQADPVGGGLQPLQAGAARLLHRPRRRASEVEHPAHRAHRLRQDAHGPDPGPDAQRALRHRRRHRPHRGGLRGGGRGEHPPQAHSGRRLRRQEGRDRHHLHRRDRQDRPQEREPVDHPGRVRRGGPAGAAEDPRGHVGRGAAPGGPQAPPPRVHPDRHHQRPLHLRRRLRRHREDRGASPGRPGGGLRRRRPPPRGEGPRRHLRGRAARGPDPLRPHPRVHRPPAGGGHRPQPGTRRPGGDPGPAPQRPGEAVPQDVRVRERRPPVHPGRAGGHRR